jgi:cardiolipin synthase
LREAAQRGVEVRLLLQGKVDYRLAAMAAHVLYDELLRDGVHIHEYTPAFLHAKVAVIDADWATVGSSNIDPLSLLLNLEANLVVRDAQFTATLAAQMQQALAAGREIGPRDVRSSGWLVWLRRGVVAWCAHVYLRLAGVTGRY